MNSKYERFMKSYYPEINEMTRLVSSRFHFISFPRILKKLTFLISHSDLPHYE